MGGLSPSTDSGAYPAACALWSPVSPARALASGSGIPSGTGAGRPSPPGSFVSINAPPFIPPPAPLPICPAPRPPAPLSICPAHPAYLSCAPGLSALRPGRLRALVACLAAPGPGARFGVRCARFGVRPAPVAYYRHALWHPSPATGARFGTLHALWRPAAAFHPAQEPGGLFRPALLYPSTFPRLSRRLRPCLSALRPGRLRPRPICPAPRSPARSGRLSRRHALDPGGPFSVLFLERGSRRNGSDRIGPPPPSSQEAFPKEKEKKLNNRAAGPARQGKAAFFDGRPERGSAAA